ncbi:MAG: S-methyl-5-thioribose kinase [Alphaproteobacteria bacterium]|jgi:5-methylthioribose kinase|nr:S-methyl-5-thioribose kinase [Alphaproteobacteria bacterium]
MNTTTARAYRAHAPETLGAALAELPAVAARLGGTVDDWRVREVGDGNINLVFIVEGPRGSVVAKQALPYVRLVGESWPLPLARASFEHAALVEQARHAPARVPEVHHFDESQALVVMEHLTPHLILRKGLIAGTVYPKLAEHVAELLAETLFKTSDLHLAAADKKQKMKFFCDNTALCKITEDLIFTDPYRDAELNRHTSPQLDALALQFRRDTPLKRAAQELKRRFLGDAQALIHGDLHTGSLMVTESDTRAIDPEFAFYGPMGFDIGAVLGNLLLAYYAQDGHEERPGARDDYREWILAQITAIWEGFEARFRALWAEAGTGDGFVAGLFDEAADAPAAAAAKDRYLRALLADSLRFGGMKMIRRILGLAHVEDLESIEDPDRRAAAERRALALARELVLFGEGVASIHEVAPAARFHRLR